METTALEQLFAALPSLRSFHSPASKVYPLLEQIAREEVKKLFAGPSKEKRIFPPFGAIAFPYFKMGAIDSLDLFGLDELILFSFYWTNRQRYKKVLDIGANIGLHSLLLAKCGLQVELFEPDPVHFAQLNEVFKLNELSKVTAHCAAVSNRSGSAEFVRVLGNTTSNHLAGAKQPYGQLERFEVPLFDIREIIKSADLFKMDVEGHEKEILLATERQDWEKIDGLVEIGSVENAKQVFDHLHRLQVNIFAQKTGWQKVEQLTEMPTSYKEGSVFITCKKEMPWT